VSFSLSSCSNTKRLAEDDQLLVKNKVVVHKSEQGLSNKRNFGDDLNDLLVQKSNKKTLGLFRLKLWFYMRTEGKKLTKFRNWIRTSVGEPPVLFAEEKMDQTATKMKTYMANKGHFYGKVETSVEEKKKNPKKVVVTYDVYPQQFYTFGEINWPEGNSNIDQIIRKNTEEALVAEGDPFNAELLDQERTRITKLLRNEGYFFFGNEYITYDLDSTVGDLSIEVFYRINQPSDSSFHNAYFMDNVYVFPNYSMKEFVNSQTYSDTVRLDNYVFIRNNEKVKPPVIRNHLFFERNNLYRQQDFQYSLTNLNSLGYYKYVNIDFKAKEKNGLNFLDAYVYMIPSKKQGFSIDLEGSNNFQGLFGVRVGLGYWNRNLTKHSDLFNVDASTGVEFQFGQPQKVNSADVNVGVKYRINRILATKKITEKSRRAQPKTVFGLNFTFQRRIEFYTLNSTSFSFGYDWSAKKNIRHLFNPFTISQVFVYNTTLKFEERLNSNPALRNAFEEQFIIGMDYTFLYNNNYKTKRPNSTMFFRGQIDIAGNFLHGMVSLANINDPNAQKPYQLFGRTYSQYFRVESDIRNYLDITKNLQLVTRLNTGIGIAYGNTTTLPYVKQFFVGGTNGLRGFALRSIGPGGYVDTAALSGDEFVDQTGDVKIEGNAELRFGIFKWIKGALFVDVGNVWLLRDDPLRPEGNFDVDRFITEFAIDMGLGVRLDFDYFVLRFDFGMKVRNPSLPKDERWVIKSFDFGSKAWRRENITFNLGIGYPF
jgi:outer membrane protein assembly factor BamA